MKSEKLIVRIIQKKKEVYYPLFTLSISYFLSWLIIIFVSFINSQVTLPFFFLSISILLFIYSLDINHFSKKSEYSVSKKLIFFLPFTSIIINFLVGLRLALLIFINLYYLIPICIYFLISVLIFFILRKEVIKYYLKKNKKIINN